MKLFKLISGSLPFTADHKGTYLAVGSRVKYASASHNDMTTSGTVVYHGYFSSQAYNEIVGETTLMVATLNSGDTIKQNSGGTAVHKVYEII